MNKVYGSAAEALDGLLFDGMLIAAGGKRVRPGFALASAGVATGGAGRV